MGFITHSLCREILPEQHAREEAEFQLAKTNLRGETYPLRRDRAALEREKLVFREEYRKQ
jgi:hypothetical protein